MNEKFIKDNWIFVVLLVVFLGGGIYFTITTVQSTLETFASKADKIASKETKEAALAQQKKKAAELKRKQEAAEKKENKSGSGKIIYEVLGEQFSPEASFGIMLENVLANITDLGIRIRSIDYNYKPANDKILQTNAPEFNACELSFVTVGNYTQIQNFFKNITKENYLTGINEVYIEPYDNDKRILIAKFKIRLYTKTVNG